MKVFAAIGQQKTNWLEALGSRKLITPNMASQKQIEANRANGRKAAGMPRDTAQSRFNAVNHGLLAVGITELDSGDAFFSLLEQLRKEWKPQGELESFLVERIALSMIRVRRATRMESEAITATLYPQVRSKSESEQKIDEYLAQVGANTRVLDPGFHAQLQEQAVLSLTNCFGRYECMNERRLFRAIEQLEQLQTARKGLENELRPARSASG
jgi:hypothetical protein